MADHHDAGRLGTYLDAGAVHTYYEVEGEGEPLVLLHGGFATIETWAAQRAALAEHYRVYLPERRGHGRTPDVPGPTGFDIMARDMIAFMETAAIPSAHLVGWSDGGIVALEMALMRPELVRKLVLIGTAAHVDGYTAETRDWNQNVTPESLPAFIREPYDALSPDGPEHFPVLFEKLVAVWRTQPRHEPTELEGVTAPTLILLGDNDVITVEHAAAVKRAIRGGQLAVVPGASHGLMFDKPDLVNRLLVDFLGA
ncbi:MAG: alpha/beta hydrolase [Chloroflexota bacterium]|nr:alpha/beta hydrolase [Chloroflexota bacterium]